MYELSRLTVRLRFAASTLVKRVDGGRDRGDVPGWVLVTLMTAALVAVLSVLAQDQLSEIFTEAMDRVRGL